MTRGVLIYAHNNVDIDYALMAIVSGGLAKKNLKVPVSLVTDKHTVKWMKTSKIYDKALKLFDKIIEVDSPNSNNTRKLHDGETSKTVSFNNGNRPSAYDITPYERTLLIDSDFLIFSDVLSNYWDVDKDVMISQSYNDIIGDRVGYLDNHVSNTGPKMYWATTVMFTKNENSKMFFNLVNYVKENYETLSYVYQYDPRQYRNDISFSIAKHIMDGFAEDEGINLPAVLSTIDKDLLYDVDSSGKLTFLLKPNVGSSKILASLEGADVHVMNKNSIVRNSDKIMELI